MTDIKTNIVNKYSNLLETKMWSLIACSLISLFTQWEGGWRTNKNRNTGTSYRKKLTVVKGVIWNLSENHANISI